MFPEMQDMSSIISDAIRVVFKRRLVDRVLRLWTDVAGEQPFPRRDQIEPSMLGVDWANCIVIAVQPPAQISHFVHVGEHLAFAHCPDDSLIGILLPHLPQVLSERRCLTIEGTTTLRGCTVSYRSALYPLSDDGIVIDHVLGVANCRPLRKNEMPTSPLTQTKWLQSEILG